ncbi:MAG: hypothetical protein K1X88_33985 [Nannocystaceae bacterium]|nr:hypothetical protein [Nannocystaceae bacterium]
MTPAVEGPSWSEFALHVVIDGESRAVDVAWAQLLARRLGPPGFKLHATAPDFDEALVADSGRPEVKLQFDSLITEIPLELTLEVSIVDDGPHASPGDLTAEVCVHEVPTRDTTIELTFEPPP